MPILLDRNDIHPARTTPHMSAYIISSVPVY